MTVYFKQIKRWRKVTLLRRYPHFHAVRIKFHGRQMVVRDSEILESKPPLQSQLDAENDFLKRSKPILDAWNSGLHSIKEIQDATHTCPLAVYQILQALKRRNLIPP